MSGLHGVGQIVRYNWPYYVGGLVVAVAGIGAGCWPAVPGALRIAGLVAGIGAAVLVVNSLAASYWIYDRSGLMSWDWVGGELGSVPRRWLNLHAGVDESSGALRSAFPGSEGTTADFFVAGEMTEPSIARARAERPAQAARVDPARLPYGDAAFDAVFLFFAAHELRRPAAREALFRELTRVTAPGGAVLVVEHARDVANLLAYGPGVLHFLPAGEWRRLAGVAGLEVRRERRRTPFVRTLLLGRAP